MKINELISYSYVVDWRKLVQKTGTHTELVQTVQT